ncbi:MAG: polysaccharide biosynthesis/export family protein, partial [Rhodoferax sp.]
MDAAAAAAAAANANNGIRGSQALPGARKAASPDTGQSPLNGAKTPQPDAVPGAYLEDTEFQRFVARSTGQNLKLFGYELFGPGAFGAVQAYAVPAGYVLGPGDELVIQAYGMFDYTDRITIDREGRIALPKAGPLTMAGIPFDAAEKAITAHLAKVYKNFSISVSMGRLRSIEVFVVGQARRPGKQVISSLSSLVNALFETGGPSSNGSLRAIELRRAGKTVSTMDMYRFLALGDSSGDARLLNGDIIYIPPAGPRAAVLGSVNAPAIYEIKANETIDDILSLSGGLPVLASPKKVQLDRINPKAQIARYVQDFALDAAGLKRALTAGDVLTVFQISPQIADVVTLEGNVSDPMRYSFKPGMKVSDLLADPRLLIPGSYWLQINRGSNTASYSHPEVNLHYATIQRFDAATLRTRVVAFNLQKAIAKDPTEDLPLQSGDIVTVYKPGEAGPETDDSVYITGDLVAGAQRFVWRPGFTVKDIIPSAQWVVDYYNYWQSPNAKRPKNKTEDDNERPAKLLKDDIHWDYAQIVRRLPDTLGLQA